MRATSAGGEGREVQRAGREARSSMPRPHEMFLTMRTCIPPLATVVECPGLLDPSNDALVSTNLVAELVCAWLRAGQARMGGAERRSIPSQYVLSRTTFHSLPNPQLFGHLHGAERIAAMSIAQRRLVVIDEHVDDMYGKSLRNYFKARGMKPGSDYEIVRLPMVEEEKSIDMVLKVRSSAVACAYAASSVTPFPLTFR